MERSSLLPPCDSQLTLAQLKEMVTFVRTMADSIERGHDLARRCVGAKSGPPS